jgi:hypothetical protein
MLAVGAAEILFLIFIHCRLQCEEQGKKQRLLSQ